MRLGGSNKMTSNLDMNNLQIKNVKDATHNQDAITLKQVNDAIATTRYGKTYRLPKIRDQNMKP